MIVCQLFDSEINYLNLKWNPNYTQTKSEERWDGGIWRYHNICTAMTNLTHQCWLSKVKNSPRRSLTGCCMVRLLSVLPALSHLVVSINIALSAVSENYHRVKYNLCMLVYFDGLLRYFTMSHLTFRKRAIIFVHLVPFTTLTNFSPNLARLSVMLSSLARVKSIKSLTNFVKWGKEVRADLERLQKQLQRKAKRWGRDGLKTWETRTR